MKNGKLITAALILCIMVLALVILMPEEHAAGQQSADQKEPEKNEEAYSDIESKESSVPTFIFALKYTDYLIETPESYETENGIRSFQFSKMAEAIMPVKSALEKGTVAYIDNYKNRNGAAPYYNGKSTDALGNLRSASAPGYYDSSGNGDFRYIPDGTLVLVLRETDSLSEVALVGEESEISYFVPQKYVASDDPLLSLDKVIAIDRSNQNIAAFEAIPKGEQEALSAEWKIVSYSLATTGKEGKYHQPTPLGYYYAIEKKPQFYYLKDGTDEIEGYAPYAIRFTAGAYIHGVSTAYQYAEDGSRIDPGINEYSSSIGTVPLSHKCVRNYTSHAKFLYDWYEHGRTVVLVIE